jgi:ABC1 atypical kinase-like domain
MHGRLRSAVGHMRRCAVPQRRRRSERQSMAGNRRGVTDKTPIYQRCKCNASARSAAAAASTSDTALRHSLAHVTAATTLQQVPQEYISELVQLQDNVPGFSGQRAISVVEEELGRPIADIYATFDPTPLAAASLGQVRQRSAAAALEVEVHSACHVVCAYMLELCTYLLAQWEHS